jgi:DNA-binding IclR family transcriptional regulator
MPTERGQKASAAARATDGDASRSKPSGDRDAGLSKTAGARETSIRRGVEVLLSLANEESLAAGGLGVTRISELLGREKSQVSRALKALDEYGLVQRNPDSTYRLGWRLYALAQLAGERRLLAAAAPRMRRIAFSLGERVHLSVMQGTDALTVLSESPGRVVEAIGWAGRATPAYCTSAGRALLLDTSAADLERMFAHVELAPLGPKTVRSVRQLATRIAEARELGYAVVDEEFEPDLIGVAVPVRDAGGMVVASLNVSAPRFRFLDRVSEAARELLEVAEELSGELGMPVSVTDTTPESGRARKTG